MRCFVPLSLSLCLVLSPSGVMAQEAVSQPLEIGPSGTEYMDAIRYRSVETDVAYYDPTRAAPRLETGQDPASPPPKPSGDGTLETLSFGRTLLIILAFAILAGLALLVFRGAGNFTLSMQSDAQNPTRARRAGKVGGMAHADGPPADLQAILATADRRQALIMLAQAALAKTVAANGILLQASWTMRDALRHIPRGQTHLDALRNLVLAGEWVLFGNRDVTEAEFQTHIATIRPLMAEART
jgi:hypothetical protein